jgi:hypothetical protein
VTHCFDIALFSGMFIYTVLSYNVQGYHIFRTALMQNNELLAEVKSQQYFICIETYL